MNKAPYQIRTTYLDGSMTTDMVNNKTGRPADALNEFIARHPDFTTEVANIAILDLFNNVLAVHDFVPVEERRAA